MSVRHDCSHTSDIATVWGEFLDGQASPGALTSVSWATQAQVNVGQDPSEVKVVVRMVDGGEVVPHSNSIAAQNKNTINFVPREGEMEIQIGSYRTTRVIKAHGSVWVFGVSPILTKQEMLAPMPLRLDNLMSVRFDIQIQEVAASDHHMLLLTSTGELLAVGENSCGELGLGDYEDRFTLTRVKLPFNRIASVVTRAHGTMAIDVQGTVQCAGLQNSSFPTQDNPYLLDACDSRWSGDHSSSVGSLCGRQGNGFEHCRRVIRVRIVW